mmetsp:Transcript_34537/g.73699  ORF Transcript_34537/g.73699 Transcript_34537/m.73699 type:complete len:281 (+) Transcript_34537:32-874(+)
MLLFSLSAVSFSVTTTCFGTHARGIQPLIQCNDALAEPAAMTALAQPAATAATGETTGVVQPVPAKKWPRPNRQEIARNEFRHGAGGLPLATATAIDGKVAMVGIPSTTLEFAQVAPPSTKVAPPSTPSPLAKVAPGNHMEIARNEFRHGPGGLPLAAVAAIDGKVAMVEMPAAAAFTTEIVPSTPSPLAKVARGSHVDAYEFRHGSGGLALAATSAIDGSVAMIQVTDTPPSPAIAPAVRKKVTQGVSPPNEYEFRHGTGEKALAMTTAIDGSVAHIVC